MKLKQWVKLIPLSVVASSLCLCAYASSDLEAIMKARNLSEKDILAAAKTYQPSGRRDEYMVFSSGGQSGQVIVYGVPSMRIYKYIAVFTPEPWQGYGYDQESKKVLAGGKIRGRDITWGDSHHPAFTERNGEYTGDYLFINDKANPRLAVIDLKSFETVQIVTNPIIKSEHGGAFVTPNSEYVIEASQYAAPLDDNYAPIEAYESRYRGAVTMWKFDMKKGRINEKESVTLELPPYMQDLSDAGKGVSDGWAFINSFNTEMYTGGIEVGMPPNEAGMSRNDHDYLHVFNWKKIAELAKDEKNVRIINGHRVVPMEVAVKNNALFLVPEPKSPHGVDVSPDGRYIVVGGKLDTHASVYDFEKIKKQIEKKEFAGKDPFGIPILDIDKSLHGQVELGLGPLHSAFDSKAGIIYTSLYVDSQVVRWDYKNLKVLDRTNVHYNIGHLDSMEGKSSKPKGQWLLALDKLSLIALIRSDRCIRKTISSLISAGRRWSSHMIFPSRSVNRMMSFPLKPKSSIRKRLMTSVPTAARNKPARLPPWPARSVLCATARTSLCMPRWCAHTLIRNVSPLTRAITSRFIFPVLNVPRMKRTALL